MVEDIVELPVKLKSSSHAVAQPARQFSPAMQI